MVESENTPRIEKRLRLAGLMIGLGLLIQILTFSWVHPLAFMTFAVIGCPIVAGGILFYLYAIIFDPKT